MARLLSPDDYAIIGMITIFICLSNTLISSGFPTALLRKKDCNNTDLSTVFYFNLVIGITLFIILWICAPWIADFYSYPILLPVSRAMGLTFLLGSFGGVSETILKRNLKFRAIAIITLCCSIVTGIIAIFFAYNGFGVWALVIQAISLAFMRAILVFIAAHWTPRLTFSLISFKEMFAFGSKLLGSNLITQLYQNMYNVTIGKFFPAATLGYFTRADGYSKLVPINIAGVVQKTLFPMLAKIQDDQLELERFNQKMISLTSFLIFPASLIMAGVAYPLISIMLTDKWIETAPLLQILCVSVLPDHLYYINNDFIMVRGHSDYVMREQFWSKILSIGILAATIPFGITVVAIGKGVGAFLTWIFSAYYLKRSLGIKFIDSINRLWPMLLISIILGWTDAWLFTFLPYTFLNLIIVAALSGVIYLFAAKILFPYPLMELLNIRK